MNKQELEQRLRGDAEHLQVSCPTHIGHRVSARLQEVDGKPARWRVGFPALAGALGALAVFVVVGLVRDPVEIEQAAPATPDLNVAPVVANSDRLLASREAALEQERQLLGRDLRNLRDHVTSAFNTNPNG